MDDKHRRQQLEKAVSWLNDKNHKHIFVDVNRFGVKQHIATIYRIVRAGKPDLWYCVNHKPQSWLGPFSVRRICTRKP